MAFTKEQKEKYLADSGFCPFCGSDQITGEHLEVESESAWQPISCNVCDKTWKDVYTLTDVETDED